MVKKRSKKPPADEIKKVDKQFYELKIVDLNRKLGRIRSLNDELQIKNEKLESEKNNFQDDRSDVTAFLNRKNREYLETIDELHESVKYFEKKQSDDEKAKKALNIDWELKYKSQHEKLTSEIKLLTSKINALFEYKDHRSDLLTKFVETEKEIREMKKTHKDEIFAKEKEALFEQNRIKHNVENRLLQLSNAFNKTRDVCVAAHTQRLIRENIALNNELNRIFFTHERLMKENEEMKKVNHFLVKTKDNQVEEKNLLVRNCKQQIQIIEKLTTECEKIKEANNVLYIKNNKKIMKENNLSFLEDERDSLELDVKILKQNIHAVNIECRNQKFQIERIQMELDQKVLILKKVLYKMRLVLREDYQEIDVLKDCIFELVDYVSNQRETLPTIHSANTLLSFNLEDCSLNENMSIETFQEISVQDKSGMDEFEIFSEVEMAHEDVKNVGLRPSDPIIEVMSADSVLMFLESDSDMKATEIVEEIEEEDFGEGSSDD